MKILRESDELVSYERKETRRILEDALYKELHGLLPTRIAEQSVDLKNTQKALSVEQVRTVLEEIHEIIGWRGISVDEDFREFVEDNLREQFSEVQKRIQNASFTETEKESLQKLQEEIFKEFEKQFPSAARRHRVAAEQESPKAQQRLAALPSSLDI